MSLTRSPTMRLMSPNDMFLFWSVITRRISLEYRMYGVTALRVALFTWS